MADSIKNFDKSVSQLSVFYLTTNQYDQLREKGDLCDNALYLTPDENSSEGTLLTRDDIELVYTTHTDKVPCSLLVYNLLKRIERIENYLGIKHPDDPTVPVDPDDIPSDPDGHILIKTEKP